VSVVVDLDFDLNGDGVRERRTLTALTTRQGVAATHAVAVHVNVHDQVQVDEHG
jgi:hypothetical protein